MKKLSELGISPTPWKVGDAMPYHEEHVVYTQNHRHDDGSRHDKVIATCNHYFEERIADARLIAVAPKLYEVCYRIERWEDYAKAHNKVIESWSYIMHDLHKALAEAAGEEVGDGK